jgi:hypothetical protein
MGGEIISTCDKFLKIVYIYQSLFVPVKERFYTLGYEPKNKKRPLEREPASTQ